MDKSRIAHNYKIYTYLDDCYTTGQKLEDVVVYLIKRSIEDHTLYYTKFNGSNLYSDTVSLNRAYKKITGKTYWDFDLFCKEKRELEEERKRLFDENKELIMKDYIKMGLETLDPKYHDAWRNIVPTRVDDIYEGHELKCALDVIKILQGVKELNNDKEIRRAFDNANKELNRQNHSYLSFSVTISIIADCCDIGSKFKDYIWG